MKKSNIKIMGLIISSILLHGCVVPSKSGILPYGDNTFNIVNIGYGYPDLRRETLQEADQHCISLGKRFSPYEEKIGTADLGITAAYSFSLKFSCLEK